MNRMNMPYNTGFNTAPNYDREHQKHNCEHEKYDCERQKHVHELTGSTAVFRECGGECHNHRFSGVSGEAMKRKDNHIHEVKFRTDFADGHYHEFCGTSGPAIEVGAGKHVHFLKDVTRVEDGHKHRFQVAALIESPLDFECKD